MSKKKLLSLALVVIMIAILSFSSLAWFTDSQTSENKFNIAGTDTDTDEDPDDIFSIDVKEEGEDGDPVDELTFEDILPGDELKKEAYITNKGAYEAYIRVTLTVTDWKELKDVVTVDMDDRFNEFWHIYAGGVRVVDGKLVTDTDTSINADGNLVVTMYLNKKLQPGETVNILDQVIVSEKATQDDFATANFHDGFQIKIEADAAQTKNILDSYSADEWQNAKATFEKLDAEG